MKISSRINMREKGGKTIKFPPHFCIILCRFTVLTVTCLYFGLSESKSPPEGVEDSPLTYISVLKGSKVTLTCEVAPNAPDDRAILVLFYKGGIGTPIYSIDAREGEFDHGSQWVDDGVIGTRAYFDAGPVNSGLVIDPVKLTDTAQYRCRVDFKFSPTRNRRVQLDVIDPPVSLKIVNEVGDQVEGAIGPFASGSKVVLRCEVKGGHPRPLVKWLRNDSLVDDTSEVMMADLTSNMLTLSNLTRNDLFASFTCQGSNSNLTAIVTSSVTIDMIFKPLELHLGGGEDNQREGTVTNLMCESKGSRPPAEITWWNNGHSLTNGVSKLYNNGNVTRSTIGLLMRMEDDKATIVCRAQNPVIPSAVLEASRKLNVLYAPRPTLSPGMNLNIDEIKEGDDIFFECKIKANPSTSTVEWYFNENERLMQNLSSGIIESNQSLVLQKVGREESGKYNCLARNEFGKGMSNTLQLRVKFSPVCVSKTPKVFGAEKNERMTVKCDVMSDPAPAHFEWAFNTSSEVVDMTWFKGHIGQEVSYTPRSDLDFGSLLCWASNEVGTQKVPCVVHVIHAGIPSPVRNCSAVNVTSCSASIECLPGWNGGLEQSFTIEVLEEGAEETEGGKAGEESPAGGAEGGTNNAAVVVKSEIQTRGGGGGTQGPRGAAGGMELLDNSAPLVLANTATSPHPVFVVEGLKGGRRYLVSISAVNAKGQSEETFLGVSTKEEEQQKRIAVEEVKPTAVPTKVPFSPLLATAVSVFVSFSLAFVLLSAILWRRHSAFRREGAKVEYITAGEVSPATTEDLEVMGSKLSVDQDSDSRAPDIIPAPHSECAQHRGGCILSSQVAIEAQKGFSSTQYSAVNIPNLGPANNSTPEEKCWIQRVPTSMSHRPADSSLPSSGSRTFFPTEGVLECLPPPPESFSSYGSATGGNYPIYQGQFSPHKTDEGYNIPIPFQSPVALLDHFPHCPQHDSSQQLLMGDRPSAPSDVFPSPNNLPESRNPASGGRDDRESTL